MKNLEVWFPLAGTVLWSEVVKDIILALNQSPSYHILLLEPPMNEVTSGQCLDTKWSAVFSSGPMLSMDSGAIYDFMNSLYMNRLDIPFGRLTLHSALAFAAVYKDSNSCVARARLNQLAFAYARKEIKKEKYFESCSSRMGFC